MRRRRDLLRLIQAAVAVAQRLVPPGRRRVAWVSQPDYADSAFHLFRHAVATRPELQHLWLVSDPAVAGRIRSDAATFSAGLPPSVRVRRRGSLRGLLALHRCRWVFHTHGTFRVVASAHRRHIVSLWHGMQIKGVGRLDDTSADTTPVYGSMHLATSTRFEELVAQAFDVPRDRVLRAALPRSDVLVRPHPLGPSRAAATGALGLPEDERLVVWLPTFRSSHLDAEPARGALGPRTFVDDLSPADWDALDAHAERARCTIVVKLHPYDPLNEIDAQLRRPRVRVVRSSEWLAAGIELYDLLAVADGLLSDVSSVVVDWLVTDKPLGIVGFDPQAYARRVMIPVERLVGSRRIHDLADPEQLAGFFALVAGAGPPPVDDLAPWLHDAEPGAGCETVLGAVGL